MNNKVVEVRFRTHESAYAELLRLSPRTGLASAALLRFALRAVCANYLKVQQIAPQARALSLDTQNRSLDLKRELVRWPMWTAVVVSKPCQSTVLSIG